MADEKKISVATEVEDNLACVAFAEAGEPCPINSKNDEPEATPATAKETKKSMMESVEDNLACTAFSDENEGCPIGKDEK